MIDIKDSIKNTLLGETNEKEKSKVKTKAVVKKKPAPTKKRRGRPSKQSKETKLNTILKSRNMTRKDLYLLILEKYPNEPMSQDAVSRIVSGSRLFYSTTTLFRICGALNITPNMALDYEKHL